MKNTFVLSCCSTADMGADFYGSRNINLLPFHYYINGKEYADGSERGLSMPEFYREMQNGATARTSQVNASEFTESFTPFLEKGMDILHVCFSGGLSGVINSALIAKELLEEKFPERKIIIIDSLCASAGYGLLMDALADLRDAGKSIDEAAKWAEENKLRVNHWFFSTDLSFYIKGGRVSRAAGLFGTMLKICPLLNMDENGKLIPRQKIRTKRAVIIETLSKMKENAEDGTDYSGKCFISHSDCYGDARLLADLIENEFPRLSGKVTVTDVGTTVGSHTGPGTVALFFFGKNRAESSGAEKQSEDEAI